MGRWNTSSYPGSLMMQTSTSPLFDWEARWWGDFVVFCAADGELQWTAALSEEEHPGAAYGFSARGFRLPGFPDPLVEILWSSHRGNGDLCLYELRDHRLHLLIKTTAVRSGSDHGSTYRGGALTRSYEDMNGDGIADLTLSGFEDRVESEQGAAPLASQPVRQAFLWNPRSGTFEPRGP